MTDFSARRVTMVDTQVRPNDVTKFPIIEAMLTIPREDFVPAALREAAYVGENLDLGEGRALLEPRTLAKMLDALALGPGHSVLDLGCGLGYSTAVVARMAGRVVGVEENAGWAAEARALLAGLAGANATVLAGPIAAGAPKDGSFDAILVQGAAEVLPEALEAQLKDGGLIVCLFMEGALGVCRLGHKVDGKIAWRNIFNATAPVLPGFARKAEFVF
jgi:protein-L-isoaspartate(D-aspartate) O-methyltransferase